MEQSFQASRPRRDTLGILSVSDILAYHADVADACCEITSAAEDWLSFVRLIWTPTSH